jgi:RNA recognition motif-containing protein
VKAGAPGAIKTNGDGKRSPSSYYATTHTPGLFKKPKGLRVEPISTTVSEAELRTIFGRYGTVMNVTLFAGHAEIIFEIPVSAGHAWKGLNGKDYSSRLIV